MRHHLVAVAAALSLETMAGCRGTSGNDTIADEATAPATLRAGMSGPAVHAVFDRLSQLGYFPNAALAQAFPDWRPVVPVVPPNPSVFDENLELAVKRFQINYGLVSSGIVDANTKSLMDQSRCGNPDVNPMLDSTDKFDILGAPKWGKTSLSYKFITSATANQQTNFANAAAQWSNVSQLTFASTAGTADISVSFCVGGSAGCAVAANSGVTFTSTSGSQITSASITVDSNCAESSGCTDLLTHELGHAVGIAHSSLTTAIMFPVVSAAAPILDDKVAIRSLYIKWSQLPGGAVDIGVGAGTRPVWIIGGDNADGHNDGSIFYFDFASQNWVKIDGAAHRIAVDDSSRPWVVNTSGQIFRRNLSNNTWEQLPGLATDIGVSSASNNDAWITGTDHIGSGGLDHSIFFWSESAHNWIVPTGGGGAVEISVSQGRPWVINAAHTIFRRNSAANGWDTLPGGGTDIGVNQGIAWIAGGDTIPNGHSLFVFDEQASAAGGSPPPRAVANWVNVAPAAITQVGMDTDGKPWVVNGTGAIFLGD
jgi:peptidoglycan hydrolase-like protein with peptidoglycan-binding domain